MKPNLFLVLLLLPLHAWGQVSDTTGIKQIADSLILQVNTLINQRDFEAAKAENEKAAAYIQKHFDEFSVQNGNCVFLFGRIAQEQEQFQDALTFYNKALQIRDVVFGHKSLKVAWVLNNLGNLYFSLGDFDKAEQLQWEAKAIREDIAGKMSADYLFSLMNLANLYISMSQYEKGRSFSEESVDIATKLFGTQHPYYASTLTNLVFALSYLGETEKAERYYLEIKEIRAATSGKNSPEYAFTLCNQANLYRGIGLVEKALPLYLEGLGILENTVGKNSSAYAGNLNSLANLYFDMGQYEKAEQCYLEVAAVQEKAAGRENVVYAWALNNLANVYFLQKNYDKSLRLHEDAKAIRERVLGKNSYDFANSLRNIGYIYLTIGRLAEAEKYTSEALSIIKEILGENDDLYIGLTRTNALISRQVGQPDAALSMYEEAEQKDRRSVTRRLSSFSERELSSYLKTKEEGRAQLFSFAQNLSWQLPALSVLCYDNTLFYKGFMLTAAIHGRRLILRDTSASDNYDRLKSYQRRLAAEYAKPKNEQKNTTDLEEKTDALEQEIARTVTGYEKAMRQVTWREVQNTLRPGDAVVEFVSYRYFNIQATDSMMYAALVLRPGYSAPVFVPLFEEQQLMRLLKGTSGGNFTRINKLYAAGASDLYRLILQPLESYLKDVKHLYCAPAGLLHRINLTAIPTDGGKTVGERYGLITIGSTRQLALSDERSFSEGISSAYLVGGIRYESDSTAIAQATLTSGRQNRGEQAEFLLFSPDSSSLRMNPDLKYLPWTEEEVSSISQLLKNGGVPYTLDTGYLATEEAFRSLGVEKPSPGILHLATHGYFFPDTESKTIGTVPGYQASQQPLMRSGLLMAGASEAWKSGPKNTGREDGILTAYEISQMNLSATELVVLSACETGLGDIDGNEGVYGLQRAFRIAGVRYIIMSLWKVDDQSTKEFMTIFYRNRIERGLSVVDAFSAAQQTMKSKYPDPYDWAAFVLIW